MNNYKKYFLLIFIVIYAPCTWANIGIPMIIIVWPSYLFTLAPVIYIEYMVMKKIAGTWNNKNLLRNITISNMVSTFIGIPISWVILLVIEILLGVVRPITYYGEFWKDFLGVTMQSAWLFPYKEELWWMIPVAFTVLLVPFFLSSYYIEYHVMRVLLGIKSENKDLKNSVWKANKYSYICLLIIVFIIFILYLFDHIKKLNYY